MSLCRALFFFANFCLALALLDRLALGLEVLDLPLQILRTWVYAGVHGVVCVCACVCVWHGVVCVCVCIHTCTHTHISVSCFGFRV